MTNGAGPRVHGVFLQNSTDPDEDPVRSQQQIDSEHLGCLRFTIPGAKYSPEANTATVQFGHALWWIEAELTADYSLHSVTLLDLSGQVAQGPLKATIGRTLHDHSAPHLEHWVINIDSSTMTGPPLIEEGDEPLPRKGSWGNEAAFVELHADADSRITRIDLTLGREAARTLQTTD